jgi:WD40 repeat protein
MVGRQSNGALHRKSQINGVTDLFRIVEVTRYVSEPRGIIEQALFSPDGQRVLACGSNGSMWLWDRESGRLVRHFGRLGPQHGLWGIAFSPDGRRVVSGGADRVVRIWDVESGQLVHELQGHSGFIRTVGYSPDGRYVASAGGGPNLHLDGVDQAIHVWDVETGQELRQLEGSPGRIWGLAYTPDGRHLFSAGGTMAILWDAQTGREVRRFPGSTEQIMSAAVFPDGRRGVTGGLDRIIRLWDLETGQEIHRFLGHIREVTGLAISPDGRLLVSSDFNGPELRLWDVEGRKEIQRLGWVNVAPTRGSFAPDGQHVAWSGYDGIVRIYRVQPGE